MELPLGSIASMKVVHGKIRLLLASHFPHKDLSISDEVLLYLLRKLLVQLHIKSQLSQAGSLQERPNLLSRQKKKNSKADRGSFQGSTTENKIPLSNRSPTISGYLKRIGYHKTMFHSVLHTLPTLNDTSSWDDDFCPG